MSFGQWALVQQAAQQQNKPVSEVTLADIQPLQEERARESGGGLFGKITDVADALTGNPLGIPGFDLNMIENPTDVGHYAPVTKAAGIAGGAELLSPGIFASAPAGTSEVANAMTTPTGGGGALDALGLSNAGTSAAGMSEWSLPAAVDAGLLPAAGGAAGAAAGEAARGVTNLPTAPAPAPAVSGDEISLIPQPGGTDITPTTEFDPTSGMPIQPPAPMPPATPEPVDPTTTPLSLSPKDLVTAALMSSGILNSLGKPNLPTYTGFGVSEARPDFEGFTGPQTTDWAQQRAREEIAKAMASPSSTNFRPHLAGAQRTWAG